MEMAENCSGRALVRPSAVAPAPKRAGHSRATWYEESSAPPELIECREFREVRSEPLESLAEHSTATLTSYFGESL